MSTVNVRITNAAGYIINHTVTATDASDGEILFDFASPFVLCATFTLYSSAGAVITNVGATITYPAAGQVKIASGGSVTLTAGQKLVIFAGLAYTDQV
jgi:hypothetical protein